MSLRTLKFNRIKLTEIKIKNRFKFLHYTTYILLKNHFWENYSNIDLIFNSHYILNLILRFFII